MAIDAINPWMALVAEIRYFMDMDVVDPIHEPNQRQR